MGNTCCNCTDKDSEIEKNLMNRGGKYSKNNPSNISIATLVKVQARIRGWIARRRIQRLYNYQVNPNIYGRGTMHIEMDPRQLEEQRERVRYIRD